MRKTLSPYKFKRIAAEALRNSLRLHFDAMLLFQHHSYPTAFQLSVLALEELAKAKEVSHYYYSAITNEGRPNEAFEQEWLFMLFSHTWKQHAYVARDMYDFSPKLVRFIQSKELELKKQIATYVGLDRIKKKVDVNSQISTPQRIKNKDAKQLIALINHEYVRIFETIRLHGDYFGIPDVDNIIDPDMHQFIFSWPHRTGLKSRRFIKLHTAQNTTNSIALQAINTLARD